MIADEIARKKQKENEKRARRWSTLLLLLLLLLFIFPFLTGKVQARQRFDRVVEIQFEKPPEQFASRASSERSSTRASSAARESPDPTPPPPEPVEQPVEQPVEKPVVEPVEQPKPMEKVKPLTTVPNRKPILTSPTSTINMEVADMIGDISDNAQVSQVTPEITEVTEEVSGAASDKISDYFANSAGDGGGKVTSSSNAGPGSDGGEGSSGSSDSGDSNTDGQGDSGDSGDDFDGNGLLTRKVIRRARLDGLIKQTGKVVINLCVNQDGKVIFAEADEYKSTIKDMAILQKAENTAAKYRYEKDYTVAKRQCGKLSFIVKLPK